MKVFGKLKYQKRVLGHYLKFCGKIAEAGVSRSMDDKTENKKYKKQLQNILIKIKEAEAMVEELPNIPIVIK